MPPLRGFAIHSRVEQSLEKPSFTQFREFLHDSRAAGRPLEKSAGLRLGSDAGFYCRKKKATDRPVCDRQVLVCAQLTGLI